MKKWLVAFALLMLFGCTGWGEETSPLWSMQWQPLAVIAFFISMFTIALAYMVGEGFHIQSLKQNAIDNFYQVLITGFFIMGLGAAVWAVDNLYIPSLAEAVGVTVTGPQLHNYAISYADRVLGDLNSISDLLRDRIISVGRESSKSGYCSILGVGYSVVGCRSIGLANSGLGTAYQGVALAITSVYTQRLIVELARQFMFNLFLPVGIFLRAFPFSRKAGGALIAIAVGFYLVFPFMLIVDEFILNAPGSPCASPSDCGSWQICDGGRCVYNPSSINLRAPSCDPFAGSYDSNFFIALISPSTIEPIVYKVIIVAVLLPAVNIFATLAFIAYFAQIAGAEIDVSMLARI